MNEQYYEFPVEFEYEEYEYPVRRQPPRQVASRTARRRAAQRRRQLRRRRQRIALGLCLILVGSVFFGARAIQGENMDTGSGAVTWGSSAAAPAAEATADTLTSAQKLAYIQAHPQLYSQDLMEFAEKYDQVIDYVYQYPEKKDQKTTIDLSAEAKSDSVPLLIQWDDRWGYQSYGSGLIGYTGCGPTCLSMVALYLTGNSDYTPVYVANWAEDNGYYASGSGTLWTLMSEGCTAFGVTARELSLEESAMANAVQNGEPVICAVGPGDFTVTGHFIVVTGYSNGAFTVNDPNSRENSEKTWTFAELSGQIKNLWAFSAL